MCALRVGPLDVDTVVMDESFIETLFRAALRTRLARRTAESEDPMKAQERDEAMDLNE